MNVNQTQNLLDTKLDTKFIFESDENSKKCDFGGTDLWGIKECDIDGTSIYENDS